MVINMLQNSAFCLFLDQLSLEHCRYGAKRKKIIQPMQFINDHVFLLGIQDIYFLLRTLNWLHEGKKYQIFFLRYFPALKAALECTRPLRTQKAHFPYDSYFSDKKCLFGAINCSLTYVLSTAIIDDLFPLFSSALVLRDWYSWWKGLAGNISKYFRQELNALQNIIRTWTGIIKEN